MLHRVVSCRVAGLKHCVSAKYLFALQMVLTNDMLKYPLEITKNPSDISVARVVRVLIYRLPTMRRNPL